MKKTLIFICLAVIILFTQGCTNKDSTDAMAKAGQEQSETPVQQSVQAFGTVKAKQVKGIMLDLPASVEKVHVQEGQRVKNGDVLITLNLKEVEKQLKEKEDSLRIAELELQKHIEDTGGLGVNNESSENEPEILRAGNDLQKIRIEYEKLEKELRNKEIMLQKGAIPQKEIDDLRIVLEQKQKEIENDEIKLKDLRNKHQISQRKDALDIKIKELNISSLKIQLEALKDKINVSGIKGNDIICDISNGVVEKINISAGDSLNSEKQIMSILDLDTLIAQANVPEDFIENIKEGSKATISPLANPDKEYEGIVSRISSIAVLENGETVVPVEIEIIGPDDSLLPNFNINVRISASAS